MNRTPFGSIRLSKLIPTALLLLAALCLAACSRAGSEAKPLAFASTIAGVNGEFGETFGIAVREGSLYISDGEKGEIKVIRGGVVSSFAAGLNTPSAIAFAPDGALIVADAGSHTIRSVNAEGEVSTLAGTEGSPGNTDGPATSATFRSPVGVAVDPEGRIFVADTYNDRIRVIENGSVSTIAGSSRGMADGRGVDARFNTPTGIAIWQDKLLVADLGNRRLRVIEPDHTVWTLVGSDADEPKDGLLPQAALGGPTAAAIGPNGDIFIADDNAIRVITGIVPMLRTLTAERQAIADGPARRSHFGSPSGLAFDANGGLLIADSDNRLIRYLSQTQGAEITADQIRSLRGNAETFRKLQPPRWPYDPPEARRDVAGTLGELRGEIKPGGSVHFHNGLDIAGAYGETARFVRSEKVLSPRAAENFGTLRELIRMPTMGYIHIRLGRDANNRIFDDGRFLFERDGAGKLIDVRVPRGAYFKAGEPIGTLNAMNHVHLIAGPSGSEMNAIDALILPGISDTRPPTIEKVTITDENGAELTVTAGSVHASGKLRVIMRAYDQVDGNSDRRRLGLYKAGYQLLTKDGAPLADEQWTIVFDRLPRSAAVPFVYAEGSRSGATGETIFNYIVTNRVEGDSFSKDWLDMSALPAGEYVLRVLAADYFGNTVHADAKIVK